MRISRRIPAALLLAAAAASGPQPCPAQSSDPATPSPHAEVVVKDGRLLAGTGDEALEIADLTAYCLGCHGGAAAGGGPPAAPKAEHDVTGPGRSHPVDTAYPDGGPGYWPLAEVAKALPLRDGRMTCLSCHAGAPDRALRLPLQGSALCIACHVK